MPPVMAARGLRRVLRRIITKADLVSSLRRMTSVVAIAMGVAFAPPSATGQGLESAPEITPQKAPASPNPLEAPLLDRSHVRLAYGWVDQWVKRGDASERPEDAAALPGMLPPSIPVTGCLGVRVTLRKSGVTLGAGEVVYDDPIPALAMMGSVRDLVPVVREATMAALRGVDQALLDAHLKAVVAPARPVDGREPDAPQRPMLAEIGPDLLVDVQVAHKRQGIRIGKVEEFHAIFRNFAPGYHGLILKHSGSLQQAAWLWPATALATNVSPRSQVIQLMADLGIRSDELVKVARPGGPVLDRFEVIHIVQPTPAIRPRFLTRGADSLPPMSLSRRGVDLLAAAMAKHLERRIGPTGLVAGTYQPTADSYNPANSPDDERTLTLYALMRWTNIQTEAAMPGTPQHRLAARVMELANDLAQSFALEQATPDPAATALTLLTLIESKVVADRKMHRDALAAKLMAMRDVNGYFVQKTGDTVRPPNHPTQSLMACALTAMYEQTRQPEYAEAANLNLAALWATQQQTTQITSLPWLLAAELRLIRLDADRGAGDDAARQAKFVYLGEMVDRLCRRQIVEAPQIGPDDVVGGFDITASAPTQMPVADWRSAFVLAFVAEALRSPQISEQEGRDRLGWLLTCGLASRFMAILTFNEASCYYVRNRPDALGGVRLAYWDNRLPAAATAMSLIAMTQFQETLAQAEAGTIPDAPGSEEEQLIDPALSEPDVP